MTYKKKLIEVALPLEAINKASAYEKLPGIGPHPRGLHLWWARRPLTACRAVLFASLVDDPSALPEQFPTLEDQEHERERLFKIIEELVLWENTTNEEVLDRARAEIMRSTDNNPPPVLDPFCGGGSIPLEAQRLGLEAHGSDLNPVAVLITKALIEIPPKFAGLKPVGGMGESGIGNRGSGDGSRDAGYAASNLPITDNRSPTPAFPGASGLAADIRHYGQWMRDEAEKRIGHLYPKVELPQEQGGGKATVIAWLWARTVQCPNPACGAQMPLVRSFELSKKKGKRAWVEPIIDHSAATYEFEVETGSGNAPDGTVNRKGGRCIVCDTAVPFPHIRSEGRAGRMSERLMAVVAEGPSGRAYVGPTDEHLKIAKSAKPEWQPTNPLPDNPRDFKTPNYGMKTFGDLFTPRQLVALTTFSDLVGEARERVLADAIAAGLLDDGIRLADGGRGAPAYADAVATYLAFVVDRCADFNNSLARWVQSNEKVMNLFARQAIPMIWDFAEANTLRNVVGGWQTCLEYIASCVERLSPRKTDVGYARQGDATALKQPAPTLVSTDPPYYDNIGYADLSDFFYIWLHRSLGGIHPDVLGTLVTPKQDEMIASPYRHEGGKKSAETFFEDGLAATFEQIRSVQPAGFPMTVFYAFKQAETEVRGADANSNVASTGWETMLDGLIGAEFQIRGTWPMRSEQSERLIAAGTNALASSVVLACRPRPEDAPVSISTDFVRELRRELPSALRTLQHGNIAPVDLAQAAIGPGMAIFSKYRQVIEPDGSPMRVRRALELINQVLDETLAEQENEFDRDTRWAIAWFEQYSMNEGPYGQAELLSQAKNSSIGGLEQAGIVESGRGKVRLLRRDELADDWNPTTDSRLPIWEATQRLIQALDTDGEDGAAHLLSQLSGSTGEVARDLAYRLYTICERKDWAQEALSYNALVTAWPDVTRQAADYRQARF